MKLKTITMSVAGLLILVGAITAQQRFDSLRTKDFQAGFNGTAAQFEKLMAAIDEALVENPKNPRAMVTHGLGVLRRSQEAAQKGDTETAGRMFQAGIHEMEEAGRIAPDNLAVLIPRGAALIAATRFMPPEMARPLLQTGLSDFQTVLELQERDETFARLSAHQRGELLTGLADASSRTGDKEKARGYFERITRELKGTVYEQRAKAWLENKPEAEAVTFFACSGCHVE